MRPGVWKRLVLFLSLVITLSACQSSAAESPTASPARSMKGYELYSWQAQGDWAFALVVGTNRLKAYDEIALPEARVQGLEALKGALDQLPHGEQVFWSAQRVPNTALPPHEIVDEITAYCGQRGIRLMVERVAAVSITPTPFPTPTPWSTPHTTATPSPTAPHLVATPWPTPTPALVYTPTPYCRPSEAVVNLSASATTLEIGQAVSVTVTLVNGASDVKLGLIQYTLGLQPHDALISDDLEPVEHRLSLEPGQSDAATFVLRAAAPGDVTLSGSTSFEIHALDYSWGSWSGCQSEPLELTVAPNSDKIIAVYDDLHGREGHAYPATTIAVAGMSVWVGFGAYSSPGVGGGVWRYDGEKWGTFTQAGGLPIGDDVQVLRAAPDGSVWAGAGCQVARFADGTWTKMAGCETLKGNVTDVVFTPDGAAWVASALELSRFDGQDWTPYGKLAHDLDVGPDGALWMSGWEGLQTSFYVARLDGADWTTYYMVDLLGRGVGSIAVMPDGDVWGDAGERGVARYDGSAWHSASAPGLSTSASRELVAGPDGVLWAASYEGLAYLDGDRWTMHEAGLGGGALAFAPDGTLWLGTPDGVLHLRP